MLDAYDYARLNGFTGTIEEFNRLLSAGVDEVEGETPIENDAAALDPENTEIIADEILAPEEVPNCEPCSIGIPGENGLDAYQLAIGAGFVGSLDDYLASLKGEKGDSIVGPQGEKGDQGEQGPKGDKGDPGADGLDGNTPNHQIDGSKVRFELPDGSWGAWIALPAQVQTSQAGAGQLSIQKFYADFDSFPVSGNAQILYFDTSATPYASYIWDGAAYQAVGSTAKNWNYYATQWSLEPTSQGTIAGGEVFAYTLKGVTRYRLVPSPYDATLDVFYSNFSAGVLTGEIVARG